MSVRIGGLPTQIAEEPSFQTVRNDPGDVSKPSTRVAKCARKTGRFSPSGGQSSPTPLPCSAEYGLGAGKENRRERRACHCPLSRAETLVQGLPKPSGLVHLSQRGLVENTAPINDRCPILAPTKYESGACLAAGRAGKPTIMWLGLVLVVVVIFALGASIVSGGIFTIVMLPVPVIVAVVALVVSFRARASGRSKSLASDSEGAPSVASEATPYPHSNHSNQAPAPPTPDQLVDAKRAAQ